MGWDVCMYVLVHAARHNDVKPLLGRELMILMYVCMYVCTEGTDGAAGGVGEG